MPSTLNQTGITQTAFDEFLASRDEPDWLLAGRRAAWQAFQDLPLPSRADEEWMRTDIRLFRLDKFHLPRDPCSSSLAPSLPAALLAHGVELGGRTIAVNSKSFSLSPGGRGWGEGATAEIALNPKWAKRGVLFGSLDDLARTHGDLVRRNLFRVVSLHADKFAALHAACWSGGTLLYVPKGVVIDKPLHTLTALSPGDVDFSHLLVVLDEGAEATLLSETAGGAVADDSASGLHCGAIELIVGPGAKLRYVNLQNWGTGVWHFAHQKALIEAGGQLQWTIGALALAWRKSISTSRWPAVRPTCKSTA